MRYLVQLLNIKADASTMPRTTTPPAPKLFACAAALRKWLLAHAATQTELIVGFYKIGSGKPSLSWPESVDEALCFGWIDGVRKRIDDEACQIKFTPRKNSSIWSAINIAKVEQRSLQGKRTAAGAAWAFLQSTPYSYCKVVLHWIVCAKKPQTRAARFQKLLQACQAKERLR